MPEWPAKLPGIPLVGANSIGGPAARPNSASEDSDE
jgi:hypothetical protein